MMTQGQEEKQSFVGRVLQNTENYIGNLNFPEISAPATKTLPDVADLQNCTNQELENLLLIYGGYRAYLELQLSYVESKKGVLEASFDEGMNKAMFSLQKGKEKKVIKEALRGEALIQNNQLRILRQQLIEIEARYVRVLGARNAYKAAYDTISRVVALRTISKEEQ